jgi:hypothetical protein
MQDGRLAAQNAYTGQQQSAPYSSVLGQSCQFQQAKENGKAVLLSRPATLVFSAT